MSEPLSVDYQLPAFAQTPRQDNAALINRVVCCDALDLLRTLATGSVDLVVTSPPYNLNNTKGGDMTTKGGKWNISNWYDYHSDNLPHEEYVCWQRSILSECMRVIKSTGATFYNHKWRVQAGLLQDHSDITAGFPVRQVIIWNRGSGHNFNDNYFVPTYEVIYMIAKPDFRLAGGKSGMGDIWHVLPDKDNDHPAPFPVDIPLRCIGSTDAKLIVDPFVGSGSTMLAAKKLNRNYIGCDISPEYVALTQRRLSQPYTPPLFADPQPGESQPQQLTLGEAVQHG